MILLYNRGIIGSESYTSLCLTGNTFGLACFGEQMEANNLFPYTASQLFYNNTR